MNERPEFRGGVSIAMKIPPHRFEETEWFYVEVLGLRVVDRSESSVQLRFGPNRLWLDRVPTVSQAEVWLEVAVDDASRAADHLRSHEVVRCDEIEPLPDGFPGFWIANPAGVVHLVFQDAGAGSDVGREATR